MNNIITELANVEKSAARKAVKVLKQLGPQKFTKLWNKALASAKATQAKRLPITDEIAKKVEKRLATLGTTAPKPAVKGLLSAPSLPVVKSKAKSLFAAPDAKTESLKKNLLSRLKILRNDDAASNTLSRIGELGNINNVKDTTAAARMARFSDFSSKGKKIPSVSELIKKYVKPGERPTVNIPVTPSRLTPDIMKNTGQVGLSKRKIREISNGLVSPGKIEWRGVRDTNGNMLGKSLYPTNERVFTTSLPSAARPYAVGNMFGTQGVYQDPKLTPPGKLLGVIQARDADKLDWRFGKPFHNPHIGEDTMKEELKDLLKSKTELRKSLRVDGAARTMGNTGVLDHNKFHNVTDFTKMYNDLQNHPMYEAHTKGIGKSIGPTTLVDSNANMWDVGSSAWSNARKDRIASLTQVRNKLRNQPAVQSLLQNKYVPWKGTKGIKSTIPPLDVNLIHS